MVMFNTKMRGQDQTGGKVNPDIIDEEAPLIKVYIYRFLNQIIIIVISDEKKAHEKRANALLDSQKYTYRCYLNLSTVIYL